MPAPPREATRTAALDAKRIILPLGRRKKGRMRAKWRAGEERVSVQRRMSKEKDVHVVSTIGHKR
jgi:hypothetical protein